MTPITLIPIGGIQEIRPGDDLPALIFGACANFEDGDILVLSSKAVSKEEGRIVREKDVQPSAFAAQLSSLTGHSAAYCELVLQESSGILRTAKGVVISRTHHGFVMANAGVDASNVGGENLFVLLPKDPDQSAKRIAAALFSLSMKKIGVVISDTFGRPWRNGQVNLAIGVSGIPAMRDYRGLPDDDGRIMSKTSIAVADELASAADLVSGKTGRIPAVVVRGFSAKGQGAASALLMSREQDLFP